MSNQGDIFVNALARRLVGAGRRDRLSLTGTSGATGTDEETVVNTLPDFTDPGDILQLVVNGDGDLVATWVPVAGSGGSGGIGRYRQFVIELDGAGGFDFILDTDGSPIVSLENLE